MLAGGSEQKKQNTEHDLNPKSVKGNTISLLSH
jgi:hypothetical protein